MKYKLAFFALFTILLPAQALSEEIKITVNGMVCSFCAQGIKKTFGGKPGVASVQVDLDKRIVVIDTKEGQTLSDQEIRDAITDAGYDVVTISREESHA